MLTLTIDLDASAPVYRQIADGVRGLIARGELLAGAELPSVRDLGGRLGEFPETTILWRCACAEDAAARVAGVNRGLEGLACDVFNQLIHIAAKIGDPIIERSVDYVLADEITHVRMGSRWLNELTRGHPERRRAAIEFQDSIDERFNLGGTRQDGAHDVVPDSIAKDARRLAGFTDEEIDRLVKSTQRSQVY